MNLNCYTAATIHNIGICITCVVVCWITSSPWGMLMVLFFATAEDTEEDEK